MKTWQKGTAKWRRKFKKGTAAYDRRKRTQHFQRLAAAKPKKERDTNGRKYLHPERHRRIVRAAE